MLILSGAHAAGCPVACGRVGPRSPTTILRHRRNHDGQFPITETVRQQDPYRPQSVLSGGVLEGPVRRHGGRTQRSRARRRRIGAEGREVPESQVRTLARKAVGPGDARAALYVALPVTRKTTAPSSGQQNADGTRAVNIPTGLSRLY